MFKYCDSETALGFLSINFFYFMYVWILMIRSRLCYYVGSLYLKELKLQAYLIDCHALYSLYDRTFIA